MRVCIHFIVRRQIDIDANKNYDKKKLKAIGISDWSKTLHKRRSLLFSQIITLYVNVLQLREFSSVVEH
jgi:hypothetical protein